MKHEITILYTPCPDEKTANKISLKLLNSKNAACIQSFKTNSMYPWNGKIEHANEIVLIIKTLNKKSSVAKSIIKENHSYEVPCIIQSKHRVNKEYYDWMKNSLH